jgi:2-phospho-L-lactate/phosphoenolpyruvate guanylyltransferase
MASPIDRGSSGQLPGDAAPDVEAPEQEAAVLIPVKAFREAKVRLAPALSPGARRQLARSMATHVARSAGSLQVVVVCDDEEVTSWADEVGARVIWAPQRGLNGAVQEGVAVLARERVPRVIVAAADLPLAKGLAWVGRFSGVTIVPDRRHNGTNVIGVPSTAGFRFSYGPGSFGRHLDEARRLDLAVRVVHSSPLAWDVDLPEDIVAVAHE